MTRDDVYVLIWGRRFYPSRLRLRGAVEVTKATEPGTIGTRGKYCGQKKPYGACHIRSTKPGRNIVALADHLRRNTSRYRAAGATEIVFCIVWRGIQGNTELTVRELAALSAAGVPLAMDYILFEEEPNQPPLRNAATASSAVQSSNFGVAGLDRWAIHERPSCNLRRVH